MSPPRRGLYPARRGRAVAASAAKLAPVPGAALDRERAPRHAHPRVLPTLRAVTVRQPALVVASRRTCDQRIASSPALSVRHKDTTGKQIIRPVPRPNVNTSLDRLLLCET